MRDLKVQAAEVQVMVRRFLSVLLSIALLAAPAMAASQNAVIYGTMYDAVGWNPMAGVTVTLENPALGFKRVTITGSDGTWNFAEVPPASGYRLTAAKGGKTLDIRSGITLGAGWEYVVLPPLKAQTSAPTGPKALSLEEVEQVLKGGVPNGRVGALVRQYGVDFTLTDETDRRLRAAGANDEVLLAIPRSNNQGSPQVGESARPAPTRAAPQVSQVSLVTQPGNAQAYVDDTFKGTTSEEEGALRIENLTPGSHRLRLTLPGYKEWKQTLTLSAGETFAVQAKLEPTGPKPLTLTEVEDAVKNVPKKGVMKWVKEFGVDFVVTDEVEGKLRAAGADAELLFAIAKAKK